MKLDLLMAYTQSHQPSDIEKRLGAIRSQLYGKQVHLKPGSTTTSTQSHLVEEHSQVQKDLFKTTILAVVMITIQVVLYFGMNH